MTNPAVRLVVERARLAKAESRRLIEEARPFVVPVACAVCGTTLYWRGERPPYTDPRCASCRSAEPDVYSG
jgi:hypothetical protein